MVLIAISLALYLVSLIPQGSMYESRGSRLLSAGKFDIDATPSPHPINPQTGMHIIIKSNGTLNMKVFNLNYFYVQGWFITHNWSATSLEEFVTLHSGSLTLEQSISSGDTTFEYVPPRIENATAVISNPTSMVVQWSFDSKYISVIASPERVFLALMITAPLGIGLTVPRIALALREKWKTKGADTSTGA